MPQLGRASSPVPQPVLVMSSRTGKFFVASGSDPHPGFPPGPPLAATIGRLSGYASGSLPSNRATSSCRVRPSAPPHAEYPPWSRYHVVPCRKQVYSGLYLKSRSVVGSSVLTDATRLSLLVPSRLVPAFAKPTVSSSKLSSAF